jgi:hypothetical protein
MKLLAAVLIAAPLLAQTLPSPPFGRLPLFPPALQRYFEFSTEQVTSIQRLNQALQQLQVEKLTRSSRVQLEIAQETAKPTLDAMALGLRYLELEAIQREIRAQHAKTYEEIQKLLTPAQKTRLEALVSAMRLQSVICEAQSQNILAAQIPANRISGPTLNFGDGQTGVASFLLGGIPGQPVFGPGCVFPGNVIRGGLITAPVVAP